MISGIGGNSYYSYQAQYNQYRLQQIMQNRYSGSSGAVSSVNSVNRVNSSLKEGVAYIKNYSSAMSDLMSSANNLRGGNRSSVVNELSASSSDSAVLEASNRFKLTSAASYKVNVDQLAAAQTNVSDGLSSSAAATENMSMQIAASGGKSVNVEISALDDKGAQKTNGQMLGEAAAAINKADIGVKAAVITENGKSSLKLQSKDTGTDSSFQVTGSFAEKGGMDQVTQAAQDAKYSVTQNGKTQDYTSQSNQISLEFGKIGAALKKTGTAEINVGVDSSKTVEAMEKFVKSYNSAVSLLSKNTDMGSGTVRQLKSLQSYVPGSQAGMDRLGLSTNKDGTLSLDKSKLSENLKKDPKLTTDLISGSSGLAQRAFSTAQNASGVSVSSLIGNSLASASYGQAADPINLMNTYSRSGAYNMMNYYATGMFFNQLG